MMYDGLKKENPTRRRELMKRLRALPLSYGPEPRYESGKGGLRRNGADGIRTHDIEILNLVVPSAFVVPDVSACIYSPRAGSFGQFENTDDKIR